MNLDLFSKNKPKNGNLIFDIIMVSFFIFIATISRSILVSMQIQPFPNFELVMVITFISILIIRPIFVFLIPLISMILSDFLLGNPILVGSSMNSIVLFTYTGFLIASFIFLKTRSNSQQSIGKLNIKSMGIVIGIGMISTLIYDIWTNGGWWYLMYPHTIESFTSVYLAGIPFMIYHQLSTVFTFLTIAIPIGYVLQHKIHFSIPDHSHRYEKIPLILASSALIILSFSGGAIAAPDQTDIWLEDASETSVSFTIQGESWIIRDQIVVTESQSVFDLLVSITQKNDISLVYYYDESFETTMITSIQEDLNGDNGYYWQYQVNGIAPLKGADKIFVSNGDAILWHYSQFS